jgi:hypothetical protein
MANTIGWGQAAVNNTIDWGKGKTNNAIGWGNVYSNSPSGETDISGTPPGDADANAFIAAAAITDATQKRAIETLVVDLKGYGIWTKMKALYPFCGGTAAQHKFNLKNPIDSDSAFRLVFNGGWTHSSNGALPNGTNAYANTFLSHSAILPLNSFNYGYYSRGTSTAFSELMGAFDNNIKETQLFINDTSSYITAEAFSQSSRVLGFVPNFTGLLNYGRLNANSLSVYRNGNVLNTGTSIVTGLAPSLNVYIGALNYLGNASFFTALPCAFSHISDGLTDTEAANYYTAVQTFQTSLGRQV